MGNIQNVVYRPSLSVITTAKALTILPHFNKRGDKNEGLFVKASAGVVHKLLLSACFPFLSLTSVGPDRGGGQLRPWTELLLSHRNRSEDMNTFMVLLPLK